MFGNFLKSISIATTLIAVNVHAGVPETHQVRMTPDWKGEDMSVEFRMDEKMPVEVRSSLRQFLPMLADRVLLPKIRGRQVTATIDNANPMLMNFKFALSEKELLLPRIHNCFLHWKQTKSIFDQRLLTEFFVEPDQAGAQEKLVELGTQFQKFVEAQALGCEAAAPTTDDFSIVFTRNFDNYFRAREGTLPKTKKITPYVWLLDEAVSKQGTKLANELTKDKLDAIRLWIENFRTRSTSPSIIEKVSSIHADVDRQEMKSISDLAFRLVELKEAQNLKGIAWVADVLIAKCLRERGSVDKESCGTKAGENFTWIELRNTNGNMAFLLPLALKGAEDIRHWLPLPYSAKATR